MSSHCLRSLLVAALLPLVCGGAGAREIRVCADPDNLPFSHRSGAGFENKLMQMIGQELGAEVSFVWAPQWRGFVRKTLNAGACDVIPGMAAATERARTTRPYYTSSYAFVARKDRSPVRSFADLTGGMTIGVQLIGDDGINSPPVEELATRGLKSQMKGFMVWGRMPDSGAPLEEIMRAVADGTVDVAIVWGPPAGYFASREAVPLVVNPVATDEKTAVPMTFEISMGVRKADADLARALDTALAKRAGEIRTLLDSYGLPQAPERNRAGLAE
jgi:mxaJ protein